MRQVTNAIFYVMRTGCQWKNLTLNIVLDIVERDPNCALRFRVMLQNGNSLFQYCDTAAILS